MLCIPRVAAVVDSVNISSSSSRIQRQSSIDVTVRSITSPSKTHKPTTDHRTAGAADPPRSLAGQRLSGDKTGDDGINESEASRDGAPAESGASITPTQRHKTPRQCRCCCCRTDRLRHSTDVTASVRGLPAGAATNTTHTHTGAYIKRFKAAK